MTDQPNTATLRPFLVKLLDALDNLLWPPDRIAMSGWREGASDRIHRIAVRIKNGR